MHDKFDFWIVGSAPELKRLIRERAATGATARLVAGFCWPWSDPDAAGILVDDVRVGAWAMPWNAKAGAGRLGPGIPTSDFWASAKEGIDAPVQHEHG
jgi:hypothetical protein